jgi:beta-glucuronidase
MLRPQTTQNRLVLDCSGEWLFKVDRDNIGESAQWQNGLESGTEIAVPGSWNEQLAEQGLMNYIGAAWYQKDIMIPRALASKSFRLYIGSADFSAKVWVNGHFIGAHPFGFLPFEFDLTEVVKAGEAARITLRVSNELSDSSIPQGVSQADYKHEGRLRDETFPPARFDFFPFGGLHRQTSLEARHAVHFQSLQVETKLLTARDAIIKLRATISAQFEGEAKFTICGKEITKTAHRGEVACEIILENCSFWSPETPHLYSLRAEVLKEGECIDDYEMLVGIREIRISGNQLLLNNKPIFLRGFGKHKDSPIFGRGFNLPQVVKDFSLMKWINANSFRTSHYPYAEEWLDFADKQGFLVISEVADISRDFRKTTPLSLLNHQYFLEKLIERDRNHPCVVAWSLSNEPNYLGEAEYHDGRGESYWRSLSDSVRRLDCTRPFTIANVQRATIKDAALSVADFISINRYYGWYENPAQLDLAASRLSEELDALYALYQKPILVSEFGADTVSGLHSTTDQLFTEEYQSRLIRRYCEVIESKPFTIGEHVWNFADFRTPQHHRRIVMNLKGVFSRAREPKLAAFTLKEMWKSLAAVEKTAITATVDAYQPKIVQP